MDIGYKLKEENPKKKANVFSKLFFGWLIGLIRRGTKQNLEIIDLYKALDKDKSKELADQLEKHWLNEILKTKEKKGQPSLLKAIWKTFMCEFMTYGVLWCFTNVVLVSLRPIILGELIVLFTVDASAERTKKMYLYSAALVVVTAITIFLYHHINFGLQVIGMRIRIAASSLIYRKITRLNQKSLGETAAGQVINLLSNDVNRFDTVVQPLHALWVMPIQVIVLFFIIWSQVGISSLAGIISMAIISLPVQGYLAKVLGELRNTISKKTDTRVKYMSEVVSGIQVIKMYAWEKPFEYVIKLARATEIKDVTSASYLRGVLVSCMVFLDKSALCFTVICYVALGNLITADKVFSLAQTYNILQMAMAIWYPMAISFGAEALVCVTRLQEFLVLEEKEAVAIEEIKTGGIHLSNVNASWTTSENTISDVTLEIPPGKLCAVVGPVGAGKSSLLQLLLGELPSKTGKVQMGGEVSYSSQEPWLFQSTVRNNILFGQPFEKHWYQKVVKVCALERDFEQFPQADRTIVGEKGVSLSGGQRARINLARAVYRHADIYLMDDPLSAVDTHVGKHLFDQCIVNHLKGKTRIIVTHQLQYLKKAGLIIVINNGKIEAQGTFEELSNSTLDFTKMLVAADETTEKQEESDSSKTTSELTKKYSGLSSRKISVISSASAEISQSIEFEDDDQVEEEESGNDPNSKPFKHYLLAAKNICLVVSVFALIVIAQGFIAGVDLWVTFWTTQEQIRHLNSSVIQKSPLVDELEVYPLDGPNTANYSQSYIYTIDTKDVLSEGKFNFENVFDYIQVDGEVHKLIKTNVAMYFYCGLIATAIFLTFVRSFLFFKACMMASVNLHSMIFNALLKAPMRFFDVNSSGRILNRFSKDMGAIDELLPRLLLDALQIFFVMVFILVNVAISNPYIIIAMVILGGIFLKFRSWYILTAKVLKHIEGITKSPVFSHVNSTLGGMTTIRASHAQDILIDEFDDHQDVHTSAWFLTVACMNSFGLWLDIISIVFLACVTFCFVIFSTFNDVNGSLVGLAISQSLVLTGMLQYGMRQTAEVINQLTSVERVLQYTKIDTEGPFETPKEKILKYTWPKEGHIEFRQMSLKYIENDPPVLNNLNLSILPGQKIGIVGRTGAGKSSLIAALFRLAPLEGSILIDGVNTKDLGLTDLRRKISIIPQEPVLFSASLRYNLDPFNEFEDDKIWEALEQVELKDSVQSLEFMVAEGGGNFSLGQRQLVCLARAALKNNKILVLDEATANVDPRTDALIQATIRKRFNDCTVLTVAHRLNTIMDSDKVLVMSFGNIIEFDHPHILLQIPDGHFHKMVLETGPVMTLQLKDIAMTAFSTKGKVDVERKID